MNSDSNRSYNKIIISPRGLSRHGTKVWLKDQPPRGGDRIFPMIVVGKFIDERSFSQKRVQQWIQSRWRKNGEIKVEKVGSVFMLHCSDIRDRDNLVDQESASLNGALFVMTPWFPQASVQAFKFKEACLWVRVEGLPLTAASPDFVKPILNEIGKVMYFDEESLAPGIKEFLRVKMRVPLDLSLIPGFYFEAIEGEFIWVYLRYEHVFIFCSVCGRIGHQKDDCRVTVGNMQHLLGRRMGNVAKNQENVLYEDSSTIMFSDKLIGLKRSLMYRDSAINLVNYKRLRPERVIRRKKNSDQSSDSSSSSDAYPGTVEIERRRRKRKVRGPACKEHIWEHIEEDDYIRKKQKVTVPLVRRRGFKNLTLDCPQKLSWEDVADGWAYDLSEKRKRVDLGSQSSSGTTISVSSSI